MLPYYYTAQTRSVHPGIYLDLGASNSNPGPSQRRGLRGAASRRSDAQYIDILSDGIYRKLVVCVERYTPCLTLFAGWMLAVKQNKKKHVYTVSIML